jgi:hypothetical protein
MEVVDLERGPLSLISTIEELLGRKSSGSDPENREFGRRDSPRWLRDILYPQKFALTSPTSGGRSVGIARSQTKATELKKLHILLITSVGVAKDYRFDGRGIGVKVTDRCKVLQFSTVSRSILRSTQPQIQHAKWAPSSGIKRRELEADHLPPSIAEIKQSGSILPVPKMFSLHGA